MRRAPVQGILNAKNACTYGVRGKVRTDGVGAIKLIRLRFDNPKLFALTLIIAILAGSYFSYAMTNSVVIPNSGAISLSEIIAKSGSPADIQAAANTMAAAGGGTVHVPAGNFGWNGETVTIPGGVNVIGASYAGCSGHETGWITYTAQTILHNNANTASPMFRVTRTTNTRISGIQFESVAPTSPDSGERSNGIFLTQCKNFRVDHCTFINFAENSVVVTLNWEKGTSAYGVIDHCYVYEPYKLTGSGWLWAYGFYSIGAMDYNKGAWDTDLSHFLGKYQAVTNCAMMFVEDCHFSYSRHATDAIQGGWNVVRYCLVDHNYPNYGSIDLHGTIDDGRWWGGRGMEVYNNTVYGVRGADGNNAGVRLRGGAGFIYNNTVIGADASSYGVQLDDYDGPSTLDPITNIHNTYVWSNTCTNCIALNVLQGTLNTDYFTRAPTQAQDGFTYTPYAYPIAT